MNILQIKSFNQKSIFWLSLIGLLFIASACSWNPAVEAPRTTNTTQTQSPQPSDRNQIRRPSTARVGNSTQQKIARIALDQVGKPYRYGGNKPSGFDCSGLVQYSFNNSGLAVPRTTSEQINFFNTISRSHLQAGDLVFFRIDSRQIHVGIMLNNHDFVHAPSSGKTVSTSNLSNSYWNSRFLKAARY